MCGACGTQAEVRRDVETSWQLDRHEMELGGEDEAEEQGVGGREAVSRVGVEHAAHRRGQAPWQEAEQSSKRSRHKTTVERRRHKVRQRSLTQQRLELEVSEGERDHAAVSVGGLEDSDDEQDGLDRDTQGGRRQRIGDDRRPAH